MKSRRGRSTRLISPLRALALCAVCVCVSVFALISTLMLPLRASAQPSSGTLEKPPSSVVMPVPGYKGYSLGAIGRMSSGEYVYCHEWGVAEEWKYTNSTALPDTPDSRAIVYLLSKYQSVEDQLTHAALAYLVHDHFELSSSRAAWDKAKDNVMHAIPGLSEKTRELWSEGVSHAVSGTEVSVEYLQAHRRGAVSVRVVNARGEAIENVPVTVELRGPAQFDENASTSITVMSKSGPTLVTWTATGEGEVTTVQKVSVTTLDDMESAQNFVRLGDVTQVSYDGIQFRVRKNFQPTVSTHVPSAVQDEGMTTTDSVTSGVRTGDVWEKGIVLSASGYLYTGLTHEKIAELGRSGAVQPHDKENAPDYIQRLENMGLKVSGVAHVDLESANQTVEIPAQNAQDSANKYVLGETDNFASWVWVIDKNKQSKEAQQWIDHDAISGLLDVTESFSARKRLMVDSTVTEHSANIDAQLTDRITVSGFPDDHGHFTGDTRYGWKEDEKYATVSLYWSQKKPDAVDAPADDDSHKLIGSWKYNAVNGVIAVGGGRPDAFGHPVHITAERVGYYAFVYTFAGDDRVMPAASAWNDEWECARVIDAQERTAITTHVSRDTVNPGEEFTDIARVEGDVPSGSYVTFSAYDSVAKPAAMGLGNALIREHRVAIDESMKQDDGSFIVTSPEARTMNPGTVYWKATVWNEKGEVLASHGLGVEGEDTTVTPPPTPPVPPEKPKLSKTGSDVARVPFIAAGAGGAAVLAYLVRAGAMVIRDRGPIAAHKRGLNSKKHSRHSINSRRSKK